MERLQDNRQVKKYIWQLQENDRAEKARECQYLMEQIDNLERQLEMVGGELKNLRVQLAKEEGGMSGRSTTSAVRCGEDMVKEAGRYIGEIKRSIVPGMRKALRDVKKKGGEALDGAIDRLHIRVMLCNVSMGMERSSAHMQETISRIAAASEESQKTKIHKRNISRALFGKGREEVPETFELGAAARNAVWSFEVVSGFCNEIGRQADRLERRVEKLSGREKTDRAVSLRREGNVWKQAKMQEDRAPALQCCKAGQGKGQEQGSRNQPMERPQTIKTLREFRRSHEQPPNPYRNRSNVIIRGKGRE